MEEAIDEQAVWRRVTAAPRQDGINGAPAPIGPELLAALEEQNQAISAYRTLAVRCTGETQRVLRRILQQEQQQRRDLGAMYYFLTGQRPCLSPEEGPRPAGDSRRTAPADAFRRRMQEEARSAGRLEALAARSTGEAQEVLLSLCRQERQHFYLLLPLLGQSIGE